MNRKGQFRRPFVVKDAIREHRNRRMARNLANEERAWQHAAANEFSLDIHNDGHHWVFRKGNVIGERWPSSAKLVIGRNYGRSLHVHDWPQVFGCALRSPEQF